MIRGYRLFARMASKRGVPVIVDRGITRDGPGYLRVRYGEKVQIGRVVYPSTVEACARIVRNYLNDHNAYGQPFRVLRRHATA